MFNLWNVIRREPQFKKLSQEFSRVVESRIAERFLELLLNIMSLALFLDENYRRNIKDFKGKYLIKVKEGDVSIRAVFGPSPVLRREQLKVSKGNLDNPDITVTFKTAQGLMNFLLSPRQDILGSLLKNEVVLSGNINYLYKLGFMSAQLQKMVLPAA